MKLDTHYCPKAFVKGLGMLLELWWPSFLDIATVVPDPMGNIKSLNNVE